MNSRRQFLRSASASAAALGAGLVSKVALAALPESPTTVTSHQLCLVYIIITYLHICLPCIMLILLVPVLCFCLPCVIRLMGMLQLGTQTQKGARQEEIEKLPTGA